MLRFNVPVVLRKTLLFSRHSIKKVPTWLQIGTLHLQSYVRPDKCSFISLLIYC